MGNSIFEVYLRNFLHFDFLIFLLALVNFFFLNKAVKTSRDIDNKLFPKGYAAGGWKSYDQMKDYFTRVMSLDGEEDLISSRRQMNSSYTVFENITAIFPLMGLLGTVISLIPMVNSIGSGETSLFFSALTSTFWGIVFAIISKGLNSIAESRVLESERNIQNFLDRYSTMVRQSDEEKKKSNN